MTIKCFQVDAFSDELFKGNPAAVCVLTKPREADWMQAVAAEMNLSETAFLHPDSDPFSRAYRLRWFTPQVEVDLCGHATLASAHVLWSEGYLKPTDPALFETRSGRLTAAMENGWITLDFPVKPATPAEPPDGLLSALGLTNPLSVGRSDFDYLIEVENEEIVRALSPDMSRLARVEARGIIVTSRSAGEYDFVSRFFAPASGIAEDPVTGSAHCTLAPFWAAKIGQNRLKAYQASPRGGEIMVHLAGERVKLTGQAVTVFKGELVNVSGSQSGPAAPSREEKRFQWGDDEG